MPVRLLIDGVRADPGLVDTNPQRKPFPGGHKFVIELSGPQADQLLVESDVPLSPAPEFEDSKKILGALELMFIAGRHDETVCGYVLNSVRYVERIPDGYRLEGICSPAVGKALF